MQIYVDYIERLTGMRTDELVERCRKTVKPGVNLWSLALIHDHPTREKERHALSFSKTRTRQLVR